MNDYKFSASFFYKNNLFSQETNLQKMHKNKLQGKYYHKKTSAG